MIWAFAAVIVGGTVASAVPGVRPSPSDRPSPSFAPSPPAPTETPSPAPEPTETTTPLPPPSESEAPEPRPGGSEVPEPALGTPPSEPGDPSGGPGELGSPGAAPDFSSCVGLTGLRIVICRHEVLLLLHPGNQGLANSLAHLRANLAKHEAHDAAKSSHGHGNPHGGSSD